MWHGIMNIVIEFPAATEQGNGMFMTWTKALFTKKFCKIFQIPHYIESLDTCMEY